MVCAETPTANALNQRNASPVFVAQANVSPAHAAASGPPYPATIALVTTVSAILIRDVCGIIDRATKPPAIPTRSKSYCKPRIDPVIVIVPTAIALAPAAALDVKSGILSPFKMGLPMGIAILILFTINSSKTDVLNYFYTRPRVSIHPKVAMTMAAPVVLDL